MPGKGTLKTLFHGFSWLDTAIGIVFGIIVGEVAVMLLYRYLDGVPFGEVSAVAMKWAVLLLKGGLCVFFAGRAWGVARAPRASSPKIPNWPTAFYHARVSLIMAILAIIFAVSLAPEVLTLSEKF